ncbi:MAG: preprotein translocase YajC subunit [Phycisphaerales bacterium]|jgi:preprotein translocase YajC subunit
MDVHIPFGSMILVMQDGVGGVVGADPGSTGAPVTTADGSPSGVGPASGGGGGAPANPFGGAMFPLLLGFLVLMIVTTMMSGRREKREKRNLIDSLGKHDKVQLSGGMIGTITEIKPDEVVVRVDESTKTTIRFMKSAVVRVLKSSGHSDTADSENSQDDVEAPAA